MSDVNPWLQTTDLLVCSKNNNESKYLVSFLVMKCIEHNEMSCAKKCLVQ